MSARATSVNNAGSGNRDDRVARLVFIIEQQFRRGRRVGNLKPVIDWLVYIEFSATIARQVAMTIDGVFESFDADVVAEAISKAKR